MSKVLSVKKLKKIYPGKNSSPSVDCISFDLEEGEILGLLGPNGSGKTTTIQMLLGTLALTSGSISYFGLDFFTHRSEVLNSISFASTYLSMPWILTVAENLEIIGLLYGLSKKESRRRYTPLLERFGIIDLLSRRIASLSAGQITRLMLVKAFFIHPKIVLLDEPTASLDPDISHEICAFILEQREKTGLSILFTSHKMDEVAEVCDRAIFLKQGKIVADDIPERLAKSVSLFRLRLVILDGMKRTVALAENSSFVYQIEHRSIEISLHEKEIPTFLSALGKADITYTAIQIEEPSLEDYFLNLAKKS